MEIRLAKGVQDEFDGHVLWYFGAERDVQEAFRTETIRVLHEIARHPLRWPKVSPRIWRCLYHRRFPFAMLYQIRKDHVLIVAILHTSRSPGYWRARVTKK